MATGDLRKRLLLEPDTFRKLASVRPRAGPATRSGAEAVIDRASPPHTRCRVVVLDPRRAAVRHARPVSTASAAEQRTGLRKQSMVHRFLDAWAFVTTRLADYQHLLLLEMRMSTITQIAGGTQNGHDRS
jgi:hypothetical protein